MTNRKKIGGGLYLVIDPCGGKDTELVQKTDLALKSGVRIVQVLDHFPGDIDKVDLVGKIQKKCKQHSVPLIINNNVELLRLTEADGLHFDRIPDEGTTLIEELRTDYILGITCSNDLSVVRWAHENDLDYISFCSMFPSPSADGCEIVDHETVRKTRAITDKPLFLAGGINLKNLESLSQLDFDGIALISGIMQAKDIPSDTAGFLTAFHKLNNDHENTNH